MRKKVLLSFVVFLILILSGCVFGSGNLVTKDFTPESDFKGIQAKGVCDINITQADDFDVSVVVDDNILQYVDISVESEKLIITMDCDDTNISNYTYEINIKMPALDSIDLEGTTNCKISEMSLSGNMSIAMDGVNEIDSDSSYMNGDLTLVTKGTNDVNLYGLVVTGNANIECDGVQNVDIDISGSISGSIEGTTTLNYKNANEENLTKSGVYTINKK